MVKPQTQTDSEVPIDKINIEILEISQNFKNVARFNLKLFNRVWMYSNSKGLNIQEWFGSNFLTWNIRNVWGARDDGHHYDVAS